MQLNVHIGYSVGMSDGYHLITQAWETDFLFDRVHLDCPTMETLAGLAPANLLNHIIGVFSKPIVKPDGSLNLVKAALFSCTLSAGVSIYSK